MNKHSFPMTIMAGIAAIMCALIFFGLMTENDNLRQKIEQSDREIRQLQLALSKATNYPVQAPSQTVKWVEETNVVTGAVVTTTTTADDIYFPPDVKVYRTLPTARK